jgi:hypothetical protein
MGLQLLIFSILLLHDDDDEERAGTKLRACMQAHTHTHSLSHSHQASIIENKYKPSFQSERRDQTRNRSNYDPTDKVELSQMFLHQEHVQVIEVLSLLTCTNYAVYHKTMNSR